MQVLEVTLCFVLLEGTEVSCEKLSRICHATVRILQPLKYSKELVPDPSLLLFQIPERREFIRKAPF